MLGVLAAMPISLPIPGLTGNPTWYIFLAWFLLSAGTVVPPQWTESEWLGADWFPGIVIDENASVYLATEDPRQASLRTGKLMH